MTTQFHVGVNAWCANCSKSFSILLSTLFICNII